MGRERRIGDPDGPSEKFWEDHYRGREMRRSVRPGAVLAEVVGPLAPGSALDRGCGEGGDAVWLATRGWRVTAVDVSETALERTAEHAAEAVVGDRVDLSRRDLGRSFPEGKFDLVSAQYLHSPVESFAEERVLRRAADAVASGGLLLVVGHASVAPWSWNRDRDVRFPAPREVLDSIGLDMEFWDVEILGSPQREATGPSGETATVTDNVIALRRLSR